MTECKGVIGVVGSGTMGAGIALVALQAGFEVVLYDVQMPALERAQSEIGKRLARLVEKGTLSREDADVCCSHLEIATDLDAISAAGLVIEAAPERMELKQRIFTALDEVCDANAILATNTSSLSVSVIGATTKAPQRVVGMHFFNPAPVMKLVEVVVGEDTAPDVVKRVEAIALEMGKQPIVCKDTPGFIVNRVARNFYGESLRIVGEGSAAPEVVDVLMQQGAGFRMGPFALMDLIGIDVNFDVTQSVYHACHEEPRYRPHLLQAQKVAMGHLGRKTGRGFYRHDGSQTVGVVPAPEHLLDARMPERLLVIGDTPLAMALQRRIAKFRGVTEDVCGLVYSGPVRKWDTVASKWRAEEVEAWLRQRRPDVVLVSVAGEARYHREILQAVERGMPDDGVILTSLAGPSATEQASWLVHPRRLLGFSAVLPLAATDGPEGQRMEWTLPLQAEGWDAGAIVQGVAACLRLYPIRVRDGAGGVMMRVLCMVFNEAAEAVREGVASPLDIDTGMQLGTNYPAGPTHWMDQLGLPSVWSTLQALFSELGDDRYRPSPLLRKMVLAGLHGEESGCGWYRYPRPEQSTNLGGKNAWQTKN